MEETRDIRRTAGEDAAVEAAILSHLLALHPGCLSFEELLRAIAEEPEDFSQRDAVERGVRELAAAGLLHRSEGFVLPSRAAVRCDELLGG